MAKADHIDMKSLARMGAVARLAELEREIAALKRVFPGLRSRSVDVVDVQDPQAAAGRVVAKVAKKAPARNVRRGRRTPMTAAEKRAVSDRMKKYWAGRQTERKAKAETQSDV